MENSFNYMAKNKLSKAKKLPAKLEDYDYLLRDIKSIIEKAKAYQAVDNIKVQTYWQIGERIVREEFAHKERADYGKYLVDNLSVDLSIGKRELYRIIRFYRFYKTILFAPKTSLCL